MNNNFTTEEFGALDMLNVMSLITQLQNMQKDETHNKALAAIIKEIFNEIQKLHKENDLILEKLETIQNKL